MATIIEKFFDNEKNFYDMCTGCNACLTKCEFDAINLLVDKNGFWYPNVSAEKCKKCGKCLKKCPVINQTDKIKQEFSGVTYIAWNKDKRKREESSSGGIFTAIAESVLKENGIVVGAALNADLKSVYHKIVYRISDLDCLRGSKYLQSNIDPQVYNEVLAQLQDGKKVLFSGTPCQIAGIKSFLKNIPENLVTIDIVCHGVPTPTAWQKYLEIMGEKYKAQPLAVNFRAKPNGWKKFEMCLEFPKHLYSCWFNQDLYGRSFINNMFLRKCCYKCYFKSFPREGDITLGDFWKPPLKYVSDDSGYSLVLCNTTHGRDIISGLDEKIYYEEVDLKAAFPGNSALYKSSDCFEMREMALNQLQTLKFDDIINQWTSMKLMFRIKREILKFLKRISG